MVPSVDPSGDPGSVPAYVPSVNPPKAPSKQQVLDLQEEIPATLEQVRALENIISSVDIKVNGYVKEIISDNKSKITQL